MALTRTSEFLARVLPAGTVGAEADRHDADVPLWPEEAALAAGALPKRVRELTAGRSCARRALAALGAPVMAVLADPQRVPRWPPGVVGSITHTEDYVAAAVGWQSQWRAIGLDAEHVARVRPQIMHLIAGGDELAWLATLPDARRAHGRALLFSSKEAAYKCQFAITRESLDFLDLTLELDEPLLGLDGAFRVHFRSGTAASLLPPIEGRFTVGAERVVTVALIAAGADRSARHSANRSMER